MIGELKLTHYPKTRPPLLAMNGYLSIY